MKLMKKRKMKNKVATLQQKLWDKAGKSEADPKFRWKCHDGRMILLKDMVTYHVWNAFIIAWEKRYLKSPYWKQAIANLYLELCSRPMTNTMKTTLKFIARRITKR